MKLLVWLGEWLLGQVMSEQEPRGDMYLPVYLLSMSLVLVVCGIAAAVYALAKMSIVASVIALALLALGVAAFLCWKNQKILMLPNDTFEYTTFLGNKRIYRFEDIQGVQWHNDSSTLLVGEEKVHIEAMAVLSDRLIKRIDAKLQQLNQENQQV